MFLYFQYMIAELFYQKFSEIHFTFDEEQFYFYFELFHFFVFQIYFVK